MKYPHTYINYIVPNLIRIDINIHWIYNLKETVAWYQFGADLAVVDCHKIVNVIMAACI